MTIYDPTALRRELHEMPELALHEKRTSAYVAEKLKALGIETHENVGGSTGVVGIIRGTEPGPVFMLRADIASTMHFDDTLLPLGVAVFENVVLRHLG